MDGSQALQRVVVQHAKPIPAVARDQLLGRGWARVAGLVGPAVAAVCIAVEPAADPDAEANALITAMSAAFMFGLLGTYIGAARAAMRLRPVALSWAMAATVISIVMTVACPVSGHHAGFGAWWIVQLAACAGAVGLIRAGVASTRR